MPNTRRPAAIDARAKRATIEQLVEADRLAQATQASQKLKTHARQATTMGMKRFLGPGSRLEDMVALSHTSVLILFARALAFGEQAPSFAAATSPDPTNASCTEKIQLPAYPPLARNAGLQGRVVVTLRVASDGTMGEFSAESNLNNDPAGMALVAPVEHALRKSEFRRDCVGKQVTLIFEFRISGDANDPVLQQTAFGYPNRFWITTRPGVLNQ